MSSLYGVLPNRVPQRISSAYELTLDGVCISSEGGRKNNKHNTATKSRFPYTRISNLRYSATEDASLSKPSRRTALLAPTKLGEGLDLQLSPTIQRVFLYPNFKDVARLWVTCPTTFCYSPFSRASKRMSFRLRLMCSCHGYHPATLIRRPEGLMTPERFGLTLVASQHISHEEQPPFELPPSIFTY